jgi:hypothetical protein
MSTPSHLPDPLDLTNPNHQRKIREAADQIIAAHQSFQLLISAEKAAIDQKSQLPFSAHLAFKLAHSRALLMNLDQAVHLSVVFAIYKEHKRILNRDEHEHGEDFLREKIKQMQWLCQDLPGITWDMMVVDDGCPAGSGRLAQQIATDHPAGKDVRILFLEDAIRHRHPIIQPMTSTDQSRKGGAVILGLWESLQNSRPNHIVLYTDADLSTDLGQCGLLVEGIVNNGADAAIGSRRESLSMVIKGGKRNVRGKLFIYLWKRLLPTLSNIIDTQCGFKAFRADVAGHILAGLMEKRFAFDIELLLKTELNRSDAIAKIPIAWFDSEAASTTADLQPYLAMLQSITKFYRTYLPGNQESEKFARLIDRLDEPSWNRLLEKIPEEITKREPTEFVDFNNVTADELAKAAGID